MSEPRLLITGASGNVGSELVRLLHADKTPLLTAGRRPMPDLPWRYLDFTNLTSMQSALAGIERVFLVRPPEMADVKHTLIPFLRQARRSGVQQVVFLSLQGAEKNPMVPHYSVEQALLELGLGYTFLRAGFFMQNLSTAHRDEITRYRELRVPAGTGLTAFVDCRDLAEAARITLTQPGHLGQAYELTGSEALSYGQVAEILSTELGETVSYTNPSLPGFVLQRLRQGQPLSFTLIMGAIYTVARLGKAGQISDTLARLLGRSPRSLREFASDYRACWLPTPEH